MKQKNILFIAFVTVCMLIPSMPLQSADKAPLQSNRAEKQERRDGRKEQRQEARSERAANFDGALRGIAETTKADMEKREQLKNDLARGKGVNTSLKSVRLKLPFVSQQHDGWSCGLHSAARLLAHKKYDVSYEQLMQQRQLASLQLSSDKGPYTLPPAMQRILRTRHPDSWWIPGAEFDVIKNLLRQQKPVAALIEIPGSSYKVSIAGMDIKAQATHWIVVSGFDEASKTIYYYDPLKEGEQQETYENFLKVWATSPQDFMDDELNPLLLAYGFMASRTIAFCN